MLLNRIRKFLLKHDINSYSECEYIKPTWKVKLIDDTEMELKVPKYSYCNIDWILKERIIEDICLKIDAITIIPMSQIKEIKLLKCDKFLVHTYDWVCNRNLYWHNTLEELQKQDLEFQKKIEKYKTITSVL